MLEWTALAISLISYINVAMTRHFLIETEGGAGPNKNGTLEYAAVDGSKTKNEGK